MSTNKSNTPLSPVPPDRNQVRNNKPAVSEHIRQLTAHTAWLYGHVQGGETITAKDGTVHPNMAPPSPMAQKRGHTHSGGVDGRPLYRDVATISLDSFDRRSSNLSPSARLFEFNLGAGPNSASTQTGSATVVLDVPGCESATGAFQNMGVRVSARVISSSGMQNGDAVTVTLANPNPAVSRNAVFTKTALTSATPFEVFFQTTLGTVDALEVDVGRPNALSISATLTTNGTTGLRSIVLQALSVSVGVLDDS